MSQVWTARESAITWLSGFKPGWLPSGLETQIRVVGRAEHVGLEVAGVVGAIPLLNGDTLQLTPKVGVLNFFRMLLTAEGLFDDLKNQFNDFVNYASNDDAALPHIIAKSYFTQLREVMSSSLKFHRTKVTTSSDFAMGPIEPVQTAMWLRMRHERPVVSKMNIRDYSTPENRILAAAADVGLGYLGYETLKSHSPWVTSFSSRFRSPKTVLDDLAIVNANLSKRRFSGSRGYYVKALTLAKLLLGQNGLAQGSSVDVFADSILLNTATLFEQYVRSIVSSRYSPEGVIVRKGSTPQKFLYTDNSYGLNPDITLARGTRFLSVGDAKYKFPDAGDQYQLAAYMAAHDVLYGFLLSPDFEGSVPKVVSRVTMNGKKVIEIALPLSDLEATEKMLTNLHTVVPFLQ